MKDHPYKQFQNIKLWKVVEQTILELEENQDLKLTTAREYVIGFICKNLDDSGVLKNNVETKNEIAEIEK